MTFSYHDVATYVTKHWWDDKQNSNVSPELLEKYVENLEKYKINSFFLPKYIQILKRIKPAETVVNLLGPFTIAQLLTNKDDQHILSDKCYRKLVIQAVSVKAMWIINKIKEASPDTVPIIILEGYKLS